MSYSHAPLNYRRSQGYGYPSSSRGLGYRLVDVNKSYGTNINVNSYVGKGKDGLAGYVASLFGDTASLISSFYPLQKKKENELYIGGDVRTKYELGMLKKRKQGLVKVDEYDLGSMKNPVTDLEAKLFLN